MFFATLPSYWELGIEPQDICNKLWSWSFSFLCFWNQFSLNCRFLIFLSQPLRVLLHLTGDLFLMTLLTILCLILHFCKLKRIIYSKIFMYFSFELIDLLIMRRLYLPGASSICLFYIIILGHLIKWYKVMKSIFL